jgi:hypothetical protein
VGGCQGDALGQQHLYGGVGQDGVVEESGDGAGKEAASETVERLRRRRRRRKKRKDLSLSKVVSA